MAVNWGIQQFQPRTQLDLSPLNQFAVARRDRISQSLADLTLSDADKKEKRENEEQEIMQKARGNPMVAMDLFQQKGRFDKVQEIQTWVSDQQKAQQKAQQEQAKSQRENYEFASGLADGVLKRPTLLEKEKGLNNMMEEMQKQGWDIPSVLKSPGYSRDKESYLMQLAGASGGKAGNPTMVYTTEGIGTIDESGFKFLDSPETGKRLQREYAEKGYVKGIRDGKDVMIDRDDPNNVIVMGPSRKEGREERRLELKEADLELKRARDARDETAFKATQLKMAQSQRAYKLKYSGQIDNIQTFLDRAYSAKNNPNMKYVTGMGALVRHVPGTAAASLQADIDFIISSGIIETMAKLKSESPTGSTGFGALSAIELEAIKTSFSTLSNTKLPPNDKKKELGRIIDIMEKRLREQRGSFREMDSILGPEKNEEQLLNDEIDALFKEDGK